MIATQLERRGKAVDLSKLQMIAQQQRDLEGKRSSLQAEGNRIGKEVGQQIKAGADPVDALLSCASKAMRSNRKCPSRVEEKQLSSQLKEQLLTFPISLP